MNVRNVSTNKFALRFCESEQGQAQVEFAFTILALLVVIFMTIELCSAVYTYTVLSDAANEGLRYAIVHSGEGNDTNTKNLVTKYAANSIHNMTAMTVSVTDGTSCASGGPTWSPPNTVAVCVTYPYLPYLSFMSNPPTMKAYAKSRFVY